MKKRCPDDERLSDYLEGRLTEKARAAVEAHLADCEICLETVAVLSSLVRPSEACQTEPVPEPVTRSAIGQVAGLNPAPYARLKKKAGALAGNITAWVSDSLFPARWGGGRPAVVRGSDEALSDEPVQVRKRFGRLDTDIEIEKTGEETARIRVLPVSGGQGVRVTLKRSGREIASLLLEEPGTVFESVRFGHYHLIFSKGGEEMGRYAFEIRDTQYG